MSAARGIDAHHMQVRWGESVADGELAVDDATLEERSAIVGRVGAVANTLRLELVDLAGLPAAAVHGRMDYPRIWYWA